VKGCPWIVGHPVERVGSTGEKLVDNRRARRDHLRLQFVVELAARRSAQHLHIKPIHRKRRRQNAADILPRGAPLE